MPADRIPAEAAERGRAASGAIRKGSGLNTPTGKKAATRAAKSSRAEGEWTPPIRARYCAAKNREGKPCRRAPVRNDVVCVQHGGGTAVAARRQEVNSQIAETVKALKKLGVEVVQRDPREVLLEQVYNSAAMAQALAGMIRDLEERQLKAIGDIDYISTDDGVVPVPDPEGSVAQARLDLYAQWVDRAARVAKMALDAGIEERLVRLAEGQATLIVQTMRNVLTQLDLTPEQLERASKLAANELRLLAARPVGSLPAPALPGGTE